MGLVILTHWSMMRVKFYEILDMKAHPGPGTLSVFNKGKLGRWTQMPYSFRLTISKISQGRGSFILPFVKFLYRIFFPPWPHLRLTSSLNKLEQDKQTEEGMLIMLSPSQNNAHEYYTYVSTSARVISPLQGTSGNFWRHLWLFTIEEEVDWIASSEHWPGRLLSILWRTGQLSPLNNYSSPNVARAKNEKPWFSLHASMCV